MWNKVVVGTVFTFLLGLSLYLLSSSGTFEVAVPILCAQDVGTSGPSPAPSPSPAPDPIPSPGSLFPPGSFTREANGQFFYDSRVLTNRTNAICITGSRMEKLWNKDVFATFQDHVLTVSDPDIFLYGYYDPSLDLEKLFENLKDRLVTAVLMPIRDSTFYHETVTLYKPLTHPIERDNSFSVLRLHHVCHDNLVMKHAVQRGFPYDVIVRARPDMFYQSPLNLTLLSTNQFLPELALYSVAPPSHGHDRQAKNAIVYWGNAPGINDQFMAGSTPTMEMFAQFLYTMIRDPMYKPGQPRNDFVEAVIYEQVVKLGIKMKYADFHYDLHR